MRAIGRKDAIRILRQELIKLTDENHSLCEVAARRNIFCRGYRRFSTPDLFARNAWLVNTLDIRSRDDLEKYANMWEIEQQKVYHLNCACDVQTEEHGACLGWDEFTNEQLAQFVKELCGEDVMVVEDRESNIGFTV